MPAILSASRSLQNSTLIHHVPQTIATMPQWTPTRPVTHPSPTFISTAAPTASIPLPVPCSTEFLCSKSLHPHYCPVTRICTRMLSFLCSHKFTLISCMSSCFLLIIAAPFVSQLISSLPGCTNALQSIFFVGGSLVLGQLKVAGFIPLLFRTESELSFIVAFAHLILTVKKMSCCQQCIGRLCWFSLLTFFVTAPMITWMFSFSFIWVLNHGTRFCIAQLIWTWICSFGGSWAQKCIAKVIFVTFLPKTFEFSWYHFIFFSMNDKIEVIFWR